MRILRSLRKGTIFVKTKNVYLRFPYMWKLYSILFLEYISSLCLCTLFKCFSQSEAFAVCFQSRRLTNFTPFSSRSRMEVERCTIKVYRASSILKVIIVFLWLSHTLSVSLYLLLRDARTSSVFLDYELG